MSAPADKNYKKAKRSFFCSSQLLYPPPPPFSCATWEEPQIKARTNIIETGDSLIESTSERPTSYS